MVEMFYKPDYFFSKNITDAKRLILCRQGGFSVDERWKIETEWLIERIKFNDDNDLVIDYGCGIGRVAKELKNPVLGVDFSQSMRLHAEVYVNNDSFSVITPEMLQVLFDNGLRISGAISIWALQHIIEVEEVINALMKAMRSGGIFWLLDLNARCIPTTIKPPHEVTYEDKFKGGSIYALDDQIEIFPVIDKWCELESAELLPIYAPELKAELRKYRRQ